MHCTILAYVSVRMIEEKVWGGRKGGFKFESEQLRDLVTVRSACSPWMRSGEGFKPAAKGPASYQGDNLKSQNRRAEIVPVMF